VTAVGAVILLAVHRREGRRRSQFAKSLIRASALATVSLLLSPRPAAAQTVPTPESVPGHKPGATSVLTHPLTHGESLVSIIGCLCLHIWIPKLCKRRW
jgi:hydrogenase/urease accessory protein HupE